VQLLVGLGNPGARYVGTRHNFGFEAVDRLAKELRATWGWATTKNESLVANGKLGGKPIVLAKPQGFMNRSGRAVAELVQTCDLTPSELLVFLDDIALPLGAIRLRERGGDGGHRGLASVLEMLDGEEIARVRLGIRPDREPEDLSEFVLEPFAAEERSIVEEVLDRVAAATRTILFEGMSKAMSLHNVMVRSDDGVQS